MATAADYNLGPNTFPRGWFIVAESKDLDNGPMAVRFFGQDLALYRGESGKPVLLDAYCAHMGTHLTASTSAMIVKNDEQIEGDSIRCPYHGWRYNADGDVDDIPYHDGPCPKSASIESYHVREVMGMIMMWHHPEGGEPEFEPPYLPSWDDERAIHYELDHLGTLPVHPIEITDNMADAQHLGPTHGSPVEYFENEIRDGLVIQRQGGVLDIYKSKLDSVTWYATPGVLCSKQTFAGMTMVELICNTPVEDGVTQCWHAVLSLSDNYPPTHADIAKAKALQEGALTAFAADFDVWKNKTPATRVMRLKRDGRFDYVRKWVGQWYMSAEDARAVREEINGIHPIPGLPQPGDEQKNGGYEDDCFLTRAADGSIVSAYPGRQPQMESRSRSA